MNTDSLFVIECDLPFIGEFEENKFLERLNEMYRNSPCLFPGSIDGGTQWSDIASAFVAGGLNVETPVHDCLTICGVNENIRDKHDYESLFAALHGFVKIGAHISILFVREFVEYHVWHWKFQKQGLAFYPSDLKIEPWSKPEYFVETIS